LIKQTKQSQLPVLLTTDETSEPMAFLVESALFHRMQQIARQLFHMQLHQLLQQLQAVEQDWGDEDLQEEFVRTFPERARALWDISIDEAKGLSVTLDLAARHLDLQSLKVEQVQALRYCLGLMRQSLVTEDELDICHRRLIESGLPPMMGGSDELVELYLEEL